MIRKFNVNDNYFSNITVLNSYYAGFIAADGNIQDNKLTIGLSSKDTNFLEKMKNNILSTYKLYHYDNKKSGTTILSVVSKLMVHDLKNNFNIQERKSLILKPPILDNEYKDCFIIGLIDGDGSIGRYKVNRGNTEPSLTISCVGTKEMMLFVKTRFEEILGKTTSNLFCRNINKNFHSYSINSLNARLIFKFYYENYILKFNLPVLNRKWSEINYNYCVTFKKKKYLNKRKGVNIFDLNGNLLKSFETLKEASNYTGVSFGRISTLCKLNSNLFKAKQYMFSRNNTMEPYVINKYINKKYI